jgi:hypothetical protein
VPIIGAISSLNLKPTNTMKNIYATFFLICISASTHAVQALEGKEMPALKPLNWCKGSDGVSHGQIEPCGPGTTVGSSLSTVQYGEKQSALPPTDNPTTQVKPDRSATNEEIKKGGFLTLGFGVTFGLIWRLRGRSFMKGFFLGAILRILLAVFVMKY